MSSSLRNRMLSRRRLLTQGGLVGGGALVAASCGITDPDPVTPRNGQIEAAKVDRVPADDPGAREWKYGYPMKIELDAQLVANPQRLTRSIEIISVRAIHDGSTIGFRIEWADSVENTSTVPCDAFRDAVAVMFLPGSAGEAQRTMGDINTASTILQWKADWQRDVDQGVQGVSSEFPNTSVDYYPPLVNHPAGKPVTHADYVDEKARPWLPGLNVGNPNSAASRTTPVEKLTAKGFGTLAACQTQNASGRGVYEDGVWTATLAKPLAGADPDELSLKAGSRYRLAFALWLGGEGDSGSRKSPSKTTHVLELKA